MGVKLFWSSRSPFARKVMVVAHELGVQDRIVLERVVVTARSVNPAVSAANPLNKIPTLVLDDGGMLFDSAVIAEYLDAAHGQGQLLPSPQRWAVLRLQALGDGLMELSVARLGEQNRGEHASPAHLNAHVAKTVATLDLLEREAAAMEAVTLGSLSVAVALSYLDFRFAQDSWRTGRPRLAAWFAGIEQRPSMRATTPDEVY